LLKLNKEQTRSLVSVIIKESENRENKSKTELQKDPDILAKAEIAEEKFARIVQLYSRTEEIRTEMQQLAESIEEITLLEIDVDDEPETGDHDFKEIVATNAYNGTTGDFDEQDIADKVSVASIELDTVAEIKKRVLAEIVPNPQSQAA